MQPGSPIVWLFLLALPVACISWTATHEEIFREPREFCARSSRKRRRWVERKFFYIFTCEYCFSHYVAFIFLILARYRLLLDDWRGSLIGFFALVWIANIYMSVFGRLRLDIKNERVEIESRERELERRR